LFSLHFTLLPSPLPSLHTPRTHSGVALKLVSLSISIEAVFSPDVSSSSSTRRFALSCPSFFFTKPLLALDEHCSTALLISFLFLLPHCCLLIALIWFDFLFRAKLRLRPPTIAYALTVALQTPLSHIRLTRLLSLESHCAAIPLFRAGLEFWSTSIIPIIIYTRIQAAPRPFYSHRIWLKLLIVSPLLTHHEFRLLSARLFGSLRHDFRPLSAINSTDQPRSRHYRQHFQSQARCIHNTLQWRPRSPKPSC
jgi:hypothetical protein